MHIFCINHNITVGVSRRSSGEPTDLGRRKNSTQLDRRTTRGAQETRGVNITAPRMQQDPRRRTELIPNAAMTGRDITVLKNS